MSRTITVDALKFLCQAFTEIEETAIRSLTCKRKAVGCQMYHLFEGKVITKSVVHVNGSVTGECTNEVGNCGCCHAEPRAILEAVQKTYYKFNSLLCLYSPCTTCANLIVMSKVVRLVMYDIPTEHDMRGLHILEAGGVEVITKHELVSLYRNCTGSHLTEENGLTSDRLIRAQETG